MEKKKAKKDNDDQVVKKDRHSVVDVRQKQKEIEKLERTVMKVLSSLNANVSRDYGELLRNFLPVGQRGNGEKMASFCFFLQRRHQIFVQKSPEETGLFKEKFFTNIYREADSGTKYLRRRILARYDVGHLKTEEVQDIVFMTASYR